MCRSRFDVLNEMSTDINKEEANDVVIIGISNQNHSKSQIPKMVDGRTLPWIHDNLDQDVWNKWDVRLRDLYILNEEGALYGRINLTEFDPDRSINDGANYNELKQLILNAKNNSNK